MGARVDKKTLDLFAGELVSPARISVFIDQKSSDPFSKIPSQ
jgi:hypothetical protein